MNILIFGNGYTAKNFVSKYGPQPAPAHNFSHVPRLDMISDQLNTVKTSALDTCRIQKIITTSRSVQNNHTLLFDTHYPLPCEIISQATHILITIPPHEACDVVIKHHYQDLIQSKTLKWIGYLSSSSVYGDHQGDSIDEDTPLKPTSGRAVQRAKIEQQWLDLYHHYHLPVHIFRLSGIYGPGRSAIDNLLHHNAHPIDKPGHVFNRIHIDDIVQTLYASMLNPQPGRCYNVTDDEPASQVAVIQYAAKIMKMPMPEIISYHDAQLSPMMTEFFHDSKRLKNDRIKNELKINLLYPTYRQGLDALWDLVSPQ